MRKTKEDTDISRLRILDAAENEFCRSGYIAANINDIAKITGMTKGAIFWHYESKAGLFNAVLTRSTARMKDIIDSTLATSNPILERFKQALLQISHDKSFEVLLSLGFQNDAKIPDTILVEIYQNIASMLKIAQYEIEKAKKHGELRPETDVFDILSPFILVMSGFGKMREVKKILGSVADKIDGNIAIDMLFKGLLSFENTN